MSMLAAGSTVNACNMAAQKSAVEPFGWHEHSDDTQIMSHQDVRTSMLSRSRLRCSGQPAGPLIVHQISTSQPH